MNNMNENQEDMEQLDNLGVSLGEELPPLEIKQPGFLRFLPPIVQDMAAQGAVFRMEQDGTLYLDGFYKNGPMKLDFEGDQLVAIDKRNRKTSISHFDDIVSLNFKWWRMSNTKSNYIVPERPWLDKFIENKWVKRKVIFEPIEDIEEKEE